MSAAEEPIDDLMALPTPQVDMSWDGKRLTLRPADVPEGWSLLARARKNADASISRYVRSAAAEAHGEFARTLKPGVGWNETFGLQLGWYDERSKLSLWWTWQEVTPPPRDTAAPMDAEDEAEVTKDTGFMGPPWPLPGVEETPAASP